VAQQFQEWQPNGIVFEFISTSSAWNGTNQALGEIDMSTNYNALDPNFTSSIQMLNEEYSCSTSPFKNLVHGVECAPKERTSELYYIRTGTVPTGGTITQFDLGTFYIGTNGFSAANVVVGQLWVSYDITFYKKQLSGGQLSLGLNSFYADYAGAVATSHYFSGSTTTLPTSCGTFDPILANTTITFPSSITTGNYQLTYWLAGSGSSAPTIAYTTNCVGLVQDPASVIFNSTTSTYSVVASGSQMVVIGIFSITGPSAVLTFSSGSLGTSTDMTLIIQQICGVPVLPVVIP
jgi:hypothetical protein